MLCHDNSYVGKTLKVNDNLTTCIILFGVRLYLGY